MLGLRSALAYLQCPCLSSGDLQPLSFQPGMLYRYRYSLDVRLEHTSLRGAWLQAEASVQLHRLWRDAGGEELLRVQVVKPLQLLLGAVMLSLLTPFPLEKLPL